jgi:hypothetical protein
MAKTVDTYSTIEQFRTKYNELAVDVGDKSGLRTENTETVIDALNSLEDKSFFFQEFIYTATAGQSVFTGADDFSNTLRLRQDRFQVFKNSTLLLEGADYSISQVTGNIYFRLTLTSAAAANDMVVIYSFTGSYLGTSTIGGQSIGFFTETSENTIYNNNDSGIILNGNYADDANRVTALTGTNTIEMYGKTFHDGDFTVDTGHTITAPTFTDSTATITGGVGTGFSSITSTIFNGNLSGGTAALTSTVTAGGDITSSTDIIAGSEFVIGNARVNETELEIIDGATLSTTEINYLDGTTLGSVTASNVVAVDSSKDITGFRNVTATGEIEGGSLDINGNADISGNTNFGGDVDIDGNLTFNGETFQEYAQDKVKGLLDHNDHSNITADYQDNNDKIILTAAPQYGDSDVNDLMVAGAGLSESYTGTGSDTRLTFAVNASEGIKLESDNVKLDYAIVSTAPSGVGSTSTGHIWFVV